MIDLDMNKGKEVGGKRAQMQHSKSQLSNATVSSTKRKSYMGFIHAELPQAKKYGVNEKRDGSNQGESEKHVDIRFQPVTYEDSAVE